MAETLEARVRQKVDLMSNWEVNQLILLAGEQAFVVDENNQPVGFKLGTGDKTFSELPFWEVGWSGTGVDSFNGRIGTVTLTSQDISLALGYTPVSTVGYNKSNWDTAYSWGNHATAGYAISSSLGSAAYLNASELSIADTIAKRQSNGYLKSAGFQVTSPYVENGNLVSLFGNNGDNNINQVSLSAVRSFLGIPSIGDTLQSVTNRGSTSNNFIKITGMNNLSNGDGLEFFFDGLYSNIQSYARGTSNSPLPMQFYASRYYFDNGNVGINTQNPLHKLDVNGNFRAIDGKIDRNLSIPQSPPVSPVVGLTYLWVS